MHTYICLCSSEESVLVPLSSWPSRYPDAFISSAHSDNDDDNNTSTSNSNNNHKEVLVIVIILFKVVDSNHDNNNNNNTNDNKDIDDHNKVVWAVPRSSRAGELGAVWTAERVRVSPME